MEKFVKKRKNLKILVLSGGFEPERYASTLAGKNMETALKSAGYKNVKGLEFNVDIVPILQKAKPDFVFLAMLCKWGEDGIMQSLLEVMGIPYSGNGVEVSSLCKNKHFFTQFVKASGFNAPISFIASNLKDLQKISRQISYPCIIKPAYQGYSIGVYLIENHKMLLRKAEKSFKFSSRIVIQEYIEGREFTVGVIEIPNREPIMLPPIELKMKNGKIQDMESKDNSSELIEKIVPAPLSKIQYEKLETSAISLFKMLGAVGVSRFDVRLDAKDNFYYLENNTFPGIPNVETSYITTELRAAGISLENFVDYLVITGLRRKQMKLDYNFD